MAPRDLESAFPGLAGTAYEVTSPATPVYNCVAWAAAEDSRWWEPDPFQIYFWPEGIQRNAELDSYLAAFATLGYEVCESAAPEPGFEKVAIYVGSTGQPTHMARQLDDGCWTSKLGQDVDINHTDPADLAGTLYGNLSHVLRRPVPQQT